jgi:hypothetical protein
VDDGGRKHRYYSDMSASQFNSWLAAMGISGAEAGRRLGVGPNTITRYRRKGGSVILALACAALYHRQEAWK